MAGVGAGTLELVKSLQLTQGCLLYRVTGTIADRDPTSSRLPLRDGIAVLDEIEPHSWHSPEIHMGADERSLKAAPSVGSQSRTLAHIRGTARLAIRSGSARPAGEVLRLRNLSMIENIRRAEDPAWREQLERHQVLARLGRLFGDSVNPLEALHEHARTLKEAMAEPYR